MAFKPVRRRAASEFETTARDIGKSWWNWWGKGFTRLENSRAVHAQPPDRAHPECIPRLLSFSFLRTRAREKPKGRELQSPRNHETEFSTVQRASQELSPTPSDNDTTDIFPLTAIEFNETVH